MQKFFILLANDRFYGFNIDMMKEIARELDMKSYIFLEVNSSSSEQADKTWTGIIGGLMNTVSFGDLI